MTPPSAATAPRRPPVAAGIAPANRRGQAAVIVCFAGSGAAALVHETCWIRLTSLTFGSTTAALGTVLAVFFLGIALGSHGFGKAAERVRRPLRGFAALELGVAVLAMLSPLAFTLGDAAWGVAYRSALPPLLTSAVRALLVAVLLLPPAVLMGGTLPMVCRALVVRNERTGRTVGLAYAANTLGAAIGCASTGVVLLPALGTTGSIAAAAALQTIVAACLWRMPAASVATPTFVATPSAAAPPTRAIGAVFFANGLVGLGVQVAWSRQLAVLVHDTVRTYTVTLTTVLLGIVLGSALAAIAVDRWRRRARLLGALLILHGLSVLALALLPPPVWSALGTGVAVQGLLLLLPATLSGAVFPVAMRMVLDDPTQAGRTVGSMTALNVAGGVVGALLAGHVLLPTLGLQTTLETLTGIAVVAGVGAWLALDGTARRGVRGAFVGAAIAAWLALPVVLDTRLPADFLAPRERLIAWSEGRTAELAAVRENGELTLEIDRCWQGSALPTHQIVAAHLPMLLHPAPRDVLVVGIGTGQAPGRFLLHHPARLDCVDIEPALVPFVRAHFDAAWMKDPAVHLIADDGRAFVAHGEDRYDVISLEVGQLFRPGAAAFYSVEFYRRAAMRLREGGVLAQFVPLAFLEPAMLQRVLASFTAVFPQCSLWYNTQELLLIGVHDGAFAIDPARFELVANDRSLAADLRYAHWGGRARWLNQPDVLLATFLCGPRGVAELAGDAAPLSDDRPALEYAAADVSPSAQNDLAAVPRLRAALEPIARYVHGALSAERRASITRRQQDDLDALVAAAQLRLANLRLGEGREVEAGTLLEAAARAQPGDLAVQRALAVRDEMHDRLAAARDRLQEVLEAAPADALALRELGLVLVRMDRAADALGPLRQAVARRPDDAVTHNVLGAALARCGDLEGGLAEIERALTLWPGYPSAIGHRTKIRAALGLR